MAGVHQKVFGAVCDKWRRQDDRLVSHCEKLTGLTADLLGVSHYFACPLPSAVSELHHKKTCLWGFLPGLTQTRLYSHRRWLNSRFYVFETNFSR